MSRTFTNLLSHVVFSTKDREPLIVPELKSELHAYLGGLTRELKGKAYGINGTSDDVHLLISLLANISISEAMRFIKSNSSGWVRDKWRKSPPVWALANRAAVALTGRGTRLLYGRLHPFRTRRINVPAVRFRAQD